MPPKRSQAPSKGNQAPKKGNQAPKKGKKTTKEKASKARKVDDKVVKPRKIKDQKSKAFVESEESENEQKEQKENEQKEQKENEQKEQKENQLPVRRSRRSTKKAIEEDEGDDEIGIDGELDELINQSEKRGRAKENRAKKQLQRIKLIGKAAKANEKKRIRNVFKLILANQRRF